MKRISRKILLALLIAVLAIQFFQIDKSNPTVDTAVDFITMTQPPQQLAPLLKDVCYDCHSNQSTYPWYTYIQPVGWWVRKHILDAREELNFSSWGTYNARRVDKKLEEMAEEVQEGEMPLPSYTWMHAKARLSDAQRAEFADWVQSLRNANGVKDNTSSEARGQKENGDSHEEHEEGER